MSALARLELNQAQQARLEDRLFRLRAEMSIQEEIQLELDLQHLRDREELLESAVDFEEIFDLVGEDELEEAC